jgi:hypothetical protein
MRIGQLGDVYRDYGGLLRKEAAHPILDAMGEEAPLRASRYPYRAAKPRAGQCTEPSRRL